MILRSMFEMHRFCALAIWLCQPSVRLFVKRSVSAWITSTIENRKSQKTQMNFIFLFFRPEFSIKFNFLSLHLFDSFAQPSRIERERKPTKPSRKETENCSSVIWGRSGKEFLCVAVQAEPRQRLKYYIFERTIWKEMRAILKRKSRFWTIAVICTAMCADATIYRYNENFVYFCRIKCLGQKWRQQIRS